MSLLDRLSLASDSFVGVLIVGVSALFIILGCIYAVISFKQRKLHYLLRKNHEYLKEAKHFLLKRFSRLGRMQMEILGVSFSAYENKKVTSEVFAPYLEIHDAKYHARWKLFLDNLSLDPLSGDLPVTIEESESIVAYTQSIEKEGKRLYSLSNYLLDHKLSLLEAESLLLQIAVQLAELHNRDPIEGRALFHGLINLENVLLYADDVQGFEAVFLKGHGMLWSMGNELRKKWFLKKLYQNISKQIEKQTEFLAPELSTDHEDLRSSDFYSFGKLALQLFENNIPDRWRSFVKQSIQVKPEDRPKDFLELDDLLNDPELNQHFDDMEQKRAEIEGVELRPLKNARELFLQLKERQQELQECPEVLKGFNFLENRQWTKAIEHFEKLEKENPSPKVTLGLAIGFHQKGEREKAQKAYHEIQETHPELTAEFHEFLARGF